MKRNFLEYSYYLLKNLPRTSVKSDAAISGLNPATAYSREFLVPDDKNHQSFLAKVQPGKDRNNKPQDYNNKLAQAHVMLLPKLMSGELTV